MNLKSYHWTAVAKGPGGMKLLLCTHRDCGLLDVYLDYDDAVQGGKEHSALNRKAAK